MFPSRFARNLMSGAMAVALGLAMVAAQTGAAQEEEGRHLKSKIIPVYPDLAKKMNVTGTVKVQVVIAPNGVVKSTKVIGGHPVLVDSCVDAVRKWRYEPAAEETTTTVEFHFSGQ